mgnify:CR=1 FL=1
MSDNFNDILKQLEASRNKNKNKNLNVNNYNTTIFSNQKSTNNINKSNRNRNPYGSDFNLNADLKIYDIQPRLRFGISYSINIQYTYRAKNP